MTIRGKKSIMHRNYKWWYTPRTGRTMLLPLLSMWFFLNSIYRPLSTLSTSTSATAEQAETQAIYRRCVGHFFATFERDLSNHGDGDDELPFGVDRNKRGNHPIPSMLDWLHENTSCELPSKRPAETLSSFPSWKRKKKIEENRDVVRAVTTIPTDEENNPPYRAVMLLMENHPIHEEIVTLSSGLLVAGLDVTIFVITHEEDSIEKSRKHQSTADKIRSEVFARIPPQSNLLQRAEDSFLLVELTMEEYSDVNICPAPHPLHHCAIDIAPSVLRVLLREVDAFITSKARPNGIGTFNNASHTHTLENGRFDFVLIMDASFLGGLLYSEIKMLPTIAIGSHETLAMAMEYDPQWSLSQKRSTIDRIDKIFLQRLGSLGLTGAFLQANRMRRSLGLQQLKRLKSPLDFFQPHSVVAMLVDLFPLDTSLSPSTSLFPESQSNYDVDDADPNSINHRVGHAYRNFLHNIQPLSSPCSRCLNQTASWNSERNVTTIMVAPPVSVTAKWTRSLIRALTLTKQSLERYDECLFDRETCQNGVVAFEVNWLVMQDEEQANIHFPTVVPSFIHQETSINILDSAIRNPNTIVALIFCTPESNILVELGIEIICISRSDQGPAFDSIYDLLDERHIVSRPPDSDYANDRDTPSRLILESMNDDTLDPEEVATQLLRVLRRKSIGLKRPDDGRKVDTEKQKQKKVARLVTSGLERAVTIVKTSARANRDNSWDNLRQMQRVTSNAITEALRSRDPIQQGVKSNHIGTIQNRDVGVKKGLHDTFAVFVAWAVFLAAVLYVFCKDSTVMKRWRHNRYHIHKHAPVDGIMTRLSDVDDAWEMFLVWSAEFAVITSHPFTSTRCIVRPTGADKIVLGNAENEQQPPQNNHQSHMRRRRKTKTAR